MAELQTEGEPIQVGFDKVGLGTQNAVQLFPHSTSKASHNWGLGKVLCSTRSLFEGVEDVNIDKFKLIWSAGNPQALYLLGVFLLKPENNI